MFEEVCEYKALGCSSQPICEGFRIIALDLFKPL